jgi:hypothetical protein
MRSGQSGHEKTRDDKTGDDEAAKKKKATGFNSPAGSGQSGDNKSGDGKPAKPKKPASFTRPAGPGQSAGGTPARAAGIPYLDPSTHKPFEMPKSRKCPPGCFTFTHGVASLAPGYVSPEVHDHHDEDVLAPPMQSASFTYEPLEVHDLEVDDGVKVAPSEKPNYGYYLARRDPLSNVSEVHDLGDEDGDIAMADVEM